MAFVDVPDRRLATNRPQGAHAADAEHDLLLDARVGITAVQLIGDRAVGIGIAFDIAVEQIQRYLADPCFPDPQLHIPLADFDADTLLDAVRGATQDRKSTRLNSSH